MYDIKFSLEAENGLKKLKKNEPMAFAKAKKLLDELMEHPYTGTGHPHPLKEDRSGQWARAQHQQKTSPCLSS